MFHLKHMIERMITANRLESVFDLSYILTDDAVEYNYQAVTCSGRSEKV